MKNNFLRSAAMHGLIIGLALVIFSLLDWTLGFYGQKTAFSLLMYVIIIAGLVWSVISYRDKEMGGYISYGQAFSYCVVVAVAYAFIATIFSLILTHIIDPTYMDKVWEFSEQKLLDKNISPEIIEQSRGMMEKFSHPAITFFIGLMSTTFISTIVALIVSAIVKRTNPNNLFTKQD